MEILGELYDRVNPFPKAPDALHAMQHHSITEDQLALFGLGPAEEKGKLSREVLNTKLYRKPDLRRIMLSNS